VRSLRFSLVSTKCVPRRSLGRLIRGSVCLLMLVAIASRTNAAGNWRFDGADGSSQFGELTGLNASEVTFVSDAGQVTLPTLAVRVIEAVEKPKLSPVGVRVWLADGSLLTGDALQTGSEGLTLQQQGEAFAVPLKAVSKIAWDLSGQGFEPADIMSIPEWQSSVPTAVDSDLIVIRKATDPEPVYQCVPCAILSIDAEHVTVSLDEDRIPVKRERVAGLVWLRAEMEAPLRSAVVDLAGGRLLATDVRFLTDRQVFQFDTIWTQGITIPADSVLSIDLAAGRTVSLVAVPPEETVVEPFFAGLVKLDELSPAFEPRIITAEQAASASVGGPLLLVTPKTSMLWKVPQGTQRLRMGVAVERPQTGGCDLAVVVDGTEVLRRNITSETDQAELIDVSVAGGRRLEIVVDFPAISRRGQSGLGRLRLIDPRLEK
jgi:hypothetical protein